MKPSNSDKPIFVVGMSRSGTTLMGSILDSHPEVAIGPETQFLNYWWRRNRGLNLSNPGQFQIFWQKFSRHPDFRLYGINADLARESIGALPDVDFSTLFRSLLKLYAARFGKHIWGEKTPRHYAYIKQLLEWYPHARVVFMIRDPRAVVSSNLEAPWSHPWADWYAKQWRESLRVLDHYKLNSAIVPVKYEDLVEDPARTVRELCKQLEIEFDPAMLDRSNAEHRLEHLEGWHYGHQLQALQPITRQSMDKWKSKLTVSKIQIIEHYAAPCMMRWGYAAKASRMRPINVLLMEIKSLARRIGLFFWQQGRRVKFQVEKHYIRQPEKKVTSESKVKSP